MVINQVLQAIERLRRNGYGKPYYLYIDEAGEYATRKIAKILDLKRKAGIRLILSHQFPGQFEDLRVRQSIENNTKIKAAFYIADARQRAEVIKLLNYGGEITDRDVIFALASQKKQHMVLRLGKDAPRVVKVPDTPDATGDVETFVAELFKSKNYYTVKEIEDDYADRFKGLDTTRFSAAAKPHKQATRSGTKPKGGHGIPKPQAVGKGAGGSSNTKAHPDRKNEVISKFKKALKH